MSARGLARKMSSNFGKFGWRDVIMMMALPRE
jgi:hypothetical protein